MLSRYCQNYYGYELLFKFDPLLHLIGVRLHCHQHSLQSPTLVVLESTLRVLKHPQRDIELHSCRGPHVAASVAKIKWEGSLRRRCGRRKWPMLVVRGALSIHSAALPSACYLFHKKKYATHFRPIINRHVTTEDGRKRHLHQCSATCHALRNSFPTQYQSTCHCRRRHKNETNPKCSKSCDILRLVTIRILLCRVSCSAVR